MKVVRSVGQPHELVDAGTDTPDVAFRSELRLIVCNLSVYEFVLVFLAVVLRDVRWDFLFLEEKSARTHLGSLLLAILTGGLYPIVPRPLYAEGFKGSSSPVALARPKSPNFVVGYIGMQSSLYPPGAARKTRTFLSIEH